MLAKDEKASIGNSVIEGCFDFPAAKIAAAHKSEVMMLMRLNSFFILFLRFQSIAERTKDYRSFCHITLGRGA